MITEVEVFLDKKVRDTCQTAGANSHHGAIKKREISRTLLSINLHFSVYMCIGFLFLVPYWGSTREVLKDAVGGNCQRV